MSVLEIKICKCTCMHSHFVNGLSTNVYFKYRARNVDNSESILVICKYRKIFSI